jgi:hypothetical protein
LRRPAETQRLPSAIPQEPDPHGQVAMMLCESLLHLLVEQGGLSRQKVIETIDGIAELLDEAAEGDFQAVNARAAAVLVDTIRESFIRKG